MNDRRGQPRVKFEGEAIVVASHEQMRVACVDLSAGGIAVIASRSPRRLERVRIHAKIGDADLVGDALVVRGRKMPQGHLWGMRFVNLDELTRANLQRFVQQQLSISARQRQAQLFTARIQQINVERGKAAARAAAAKQATVEANPTPQPQPEAPSPTQQAPPPLQRRNTAGYNERSGSPLPPSRQPTLQGDAGEQSVETPEPAFRSGIDLPSSNDTYVEIEDNSGRSHGAKPALPVRAGPASRVAPPAAPADFDAAPAKTGDGPMVFDPGVDHQADQLDDGPVGERFGDSGLILLHGEEEKAGEAAPTRKPPSKKPASAKAEDAKAQVKAKAKKRPVADLSQDEDVAAFLASVEADADAQELSADPELLLPDGEQAEDPEAFTGVVPPDIDEDCATNQVQLDSALELDAGSDDGALELDTTDAEEVLELAGSDDVGELEDPSQDSNEFDSLEAELLADESASAAEFVDDDDDEPTTSTVARDAPGGQGGPESIATVNLSGPEALDALDAAGQEDSASIEELDGELLDELDDGEDPTLVPPPMVSASPDEEPPSSFQDWQQNNLHTPAPAESAAPAAAAPPARDGLDDQDTLHEGARTISRPAADEAGSPSLRDWEESHRTPAPSSLQAVQAVAGAAKPGPDAPSLQDWENKNLTPAPGSLELASALSTKPDGVPALEDWEDKNRAPAGSPATASRDRPATIPPAAHKVRGPLEGGAGGVPEGVFGDISMAARRAREMQGPRSYSSADLPGGEEEMLSDDDEDAFASLAAESGLELNDEEGPTFGKMGEQPSAPLDVSGQPYPETQPHASAEIPMSVPPSRRREAGEPPTSPGNALPDFGDPIPPSGFAIAAPDAFESSQDMAQSGFTMVVHMSDVGLEPPSEKPPSKPSKSSFGDPAIDKPEPSSFAVLPPSYDNTGLSHEAPDLSGLAGPGGTAQPAPAPAQSGSTVVASLEQIRAQHEAALARAKAESENRPAFVPSFQLEADADTSSGTYEPRPIAPPLPETPSLPSDAHRTRFDGPKPVARVPLKPTAPPGARRQDDIHKTIERPPLHERKAAQEDVEEAVDAALPPTSSSGPALGTGRHAMVQEALAKLRRRADVDAGGSRKKKSASSDKKGSGAPPTQTRSRRRRRKLGDAEKQNPELLDLYQKALADLDDGSKH